MSLWASIKNLFIPWNLIRQDDSPAESDGVHHVMFGQTMVDGIAGNGMTDLPAPTSPPPAPPRE
ncbi:hypothetical protein IP86_06140 [Rhodopseudomonas sp. AAP120]|uniref:hypothetical protein n=1 Tax=Rhodopseudomonas sp. AAP120 TaxID=1523430 RepID=UPI0006B8C5BB|nr:hypothetical protein [Rhodopseudomonas sp. AAP120]KPG01040.1 hypothetical protein IP86_06140 [Rhodopseudomonas sp. AAP120]